MYPTGHVPDASVHHTLILPFPQPLSRISADSGNSTMASTRASGPLKATYRPDVASSHTSRHTPRTGSVEPGETSKMQRSSSWECASSPRPLTPSNKENHLSRHSSLDTMHLSTMEGKGKGWRVRGRDGG